MLSNMHKKHVITVFTSNHDSENTQIWRNSFGQLTCQGLEMWHEPSLYGIWWYANLMKWFWKFCFLSYLAFYFFVHNTINRNSNYRHYFLNQQPFCFTKRHWVGLVKEIFLYMRTCSTIELQYELENGMMKCHNQIAS